ncbi:MAG: DUF4129 domain-containing protein, partial [Planctomycetota bacterium]|nr:DUF4129 domain-containing protein [Planctomycetota bacterium]
AAALREPSSGLGDWFGELAYDLRRWAASGDADYMRDFAAALADGPHALWESARRAPVWVWIVLGAAVLALMARRLVGRPVSIRGARIPRFHRGARIETLYASLLRVLARLGYEKRASQTPREFADEVCLRGGEPMIPVRSFTESFYRARFGGLELTTEELAPIQAFIRSSESGSVSLSGPHGVS